MANVTVLLAGKDKHVIENVILVLLEQIALKNVTVILVPNVILL